MSTSKRGTAIGLGVAAAAVAATGSIVGVSAALAASKTHTLVFHRVQAAEVTQSHGKVVIGSNKLKQSGKLAGLNVAYCQESATSSVCHDAYSVHGGLIYATIKVSASSSTGTVTGGTGAFAGAHGTVSAVRSANGKTSTLTITYST